jgi:hypothetical protein
VRGFAGTGLGLALLTAASLAVPVSGVASGASTTWQVQQSPDITVPYGQVQAVSCTTSTACVAVGTYRNSSGVTALLAERWDGTSWHQETMPTQSDASLNGVSCQASFCMAVGQISPGGSGLAEILSNGTSWSSQVFSPPTGATSMEFRAVSCVSSTFCEAVGEYTTSAGLIRSLAYEWNGTTWSIQSSPNQGSVPTRLDGVSCVSTHFCQAVDFYGAMAELWNGTTWTAHSVPIPAGMRSPDLNAVSCASASMCEAGGSFPIGMESWSGTAWVRQASVLPPGAVNNSLTGVSCTSPTDCEAVGYVPGLPVGLEEAWNGTSWTIQTRLASLPMFASVSCPTSTFCEAVGTTSTGTAAAMWNGTAWVSQSTPGTSATFSSVSCPSTTFCVAVGPSGAIAWNGTSWSGAALPQTGAAFAGVSCASATSCEAVGPGNSSGATFAAGWNGSAWTAQTVPAPAGAKIVALKTVSCPAADACEAVAESNVGVYSVGRDGTAWTLQGSVPVPAGAASETISGLSCTSASDCTLVGHAANGQALAEAWDGASWTIQDAASPAATSNSFSGVSCTSGGPCVAVGSYPDAGGYSTTLVETTG